MTHNPDPGRNSFGTYLEQLLLRANVKNATVAAALSYDVSYISKWITGKALPSKKNVEHVLSVVSSLVVAQPNAATREELLRYYGVQDDDLLAEAVIRALRAAYYEATGTLSQNQRINNAVLQTSPRGQSPLLEDLAASLEPENVRNIAVMADLFSLDHISKLQMAGIESRRFRMRQKRENLNIDYVIDLNSLNRNSAYDVILLIHMMASFSLANFRLYHSELARDKLLITVPREFAGISLLSKDHQFLCTTSTREKTSVEELYRAIRSLMNPDKLIFIPTDMEQLLLDREYFHNLISRNNRWMVGHITEHFLPPELFHQLAQAHFGTDPVAYQEAERAYLLISGILGKNKTQIILYHLALVDFMISGELDFFNRKVILSSSQRQDVLLHIRRIFQGQNSASIKLVKDGFSDDFKYISNPCFFLSDASSYLRLENDLYRDNLLLIKDEIARNIFADFFSSVWDDRQNMMITDCSQVLAKLDDLMETADFLV